MNSNYPAVTTRGVLFLLGLSLAAITMTENLLAAPKKGGGKKTNESLVVFFCATFDDLTADRIVSDNGNPYAFGKSVGKNKDDSETAIGAFFRFRVVKDTSLREIILNLSDVTCELTVEPAPWREDKVGLIIDKPVQWWVGVDPDALQLNSPQIVLMFIFFQQQDESGTWREGLIEVPVIVEAIADINDDGNFDEWRITYDALDLVGSVITQGGEVLDCPAFDLPFGLTVTDQAVLP